VNACPSILCPIDFSTASAGALRYGAAIASHFAARLIALTVVDSSNRGSGSRCPGAFDPAESATRLRLFVDGVFDGSAPVPLTRECQVSRGTPAPEIVRIATDRSCDLIVMSSHGSARVPVAGFGATTEAVLRRTSTPVLVTPPRDPGHVVIEDATAVARRIVVPVDLSVASAHQVRVARGIAKALSIPLLLLHVVPEAPVERRHEAGRGRHRRRAGAEAALALLAAEVPPRLLAEATVVEGEIAQEIANFVRHREAGLVVMGLSGPPSRGPRMGLVTYRVLCLSPALVLALPPRYEGASTSGIPVGLTQRTHRGEVVDV
jgi:nucleotide-binding universal stress UspA family protein